MCLHIPRLNNIDLINKGSEMFVSKFLASEFSVYSGQISAFSNLLKSVIFCAKSQMVYRLPVTVEVGVRFRKDFQWTKWYCDGFSSQYFSFPCHQRSKRIHLFITH